VLPPTRWAASATATCPAEDLGRDVAQEKERTPRAPLEGGSKRRRARGKCERRAAARSVLRHRRRILFLEALWLPRGAASKSGGDPHDASRPSSPAQCGAGGRRAYLLHGLVAEQLHRHHASEPSRRNRDTCGSETTEQAVRMRPGAGWETHHPPRRADLQRSASDTRQPPLCACILSYPMRAAAPTLTVPRYTSAPRAARRGTAIACGLQARSDQVCATGAAVRSACET
jgi:hypothetical protein